MDPKDYRKQIEGQLKQLAARRRRAVAFSDPAASDARRIEALQVQGPLRREKDARTALELARDDGASVDLRVAAIKNLGITLSRDVHALELLLELLGDQSQPVPVRSAALSALKVAAFHVKDFNDRRPAYIAALRQAGQSPDPDLRRRSLAVLAREKDVPTQKKLIAGLQQPDKALLSPDKALLFLSYDVKLDLHDLLLRIVKQPPSPAARLQALRMLSTNAASAPLFQKLLKNKKEPTDARLIALAALHALEPSKLRRDAAKIVGDAAEDDELREACLVAATTFGEDSPALRQNAGKMQKNAGTPSARRAAKQYLATRR